MLSVAGVGADGGRDTGGAGNDADELEGHAWDGVWVDMRAGKEWSHVECCYAKSERREAESRDFPLADGKS